MSAVTGLAILLLVGLLIRLTFAYVVLPNSGFESDIGTFTAWATRLAQEGPGTFYATAGFADYPPGYLYVLWLLGGLGQLLAPLGNTNAVAATGVLIKIPPMLADIAVGFVLYQLVRSWRAPRRDAHQVALVAAGLYVLNPVTWYDSAIWGQTDAFGALITLLTVAALVRGNSEGASALAVVAALIKPQFGIVLLPLVGVVLLGRHFFRPGSSPRNPVLAPPQLRSWFESEQGPWRLVSSAVAAMAVLVVLLTPFSLDLFSFIGQMQKTAGGYPYISVNAYNPWAFIGSNGSPGIAWGGAWSWSPDTVPLLGPIPGVVIGAVLLAVGFLAGLVRALWRDDRRSIVIVAIFLALAFFILPTRVHERYMFPIFGLLPLLAAVDRRWLWALVALSAAAFINLHGVLTTEIYATPNLEDLPFGDLFRQPLGIVTSVILHIVGFAFVAWQLRPAAAQETDPFVARRAPAPSSALPPAAPAAVAAASLTRRKAGRAERDDPGAASSTAPVLVTAAATAPGASGLDSASGLLEPDFDDEPRQEPVLDALRRWFRQLVGYRSNRRDRSALLVGESGGRLDRKDLLLILVVFASTLLLRTYRLEVPYGMHFDEVYHARTGMEFLQDWEYDMPHGIYEFTHPHLAKYAMAWGIQALGNNRVTAVQQLGTPVRAAAIEKRWSPSDDVNARNGDRFFVVGESEVRAFALSTKQLVATIPGSYVAVAVDDGGHEAYLASSDGQIFSFDTTQLDGVSPSAPALIEAAPLTQLGGLNGSVDRLAVASDQLIAVTDTGTIVTLELETGTELARTLYPTPTDVIGVNGRSVVVVDPSLVENPAALAQELATLIGRDADFMEGSIARATDPIPVGGFITKTAVTELNKRIEAGSVPGVTVDNRSALAIGLDTGVVLVDAATLAELAFIGTSEAVTGMALAERGLDHQTLYAAVGDELATVSLPGDDAARLGVTVPMPNDVRDVYWNAATTYVHVLGMAQDESSPTVYIVEPRSNSVFADARLTSEPQAVLMDAQQDRPSEDRNDLLSIDSGGAMATVDTGNNQFAYRLPGVLLGSLMAVCIYLLARFLFNRRSIAVIVSLLVLADGMMFANARIAMNDTYVAFFIVAAFTLFVPVWLERWRNPAVVVTAMVGVGVFLGLAFASKWVGAYAIGAVGLLILLRSALGRILALIAMIALTAVLGFLAITPNASVASPQLNIPFFVLMVTLTTLLAVGMAVRPVRLTLDELRFAVIAPIIAGLAVGAFGVYRVLTSTGPPAAGQLLTPTRLVALGVTLIGVGAVALAAGWLAGRSGYGPLASPQAVDPDTEPASPAPARGWLRPGSGLLGLPWLLGLAAIIFIPVGVYMLSYVPWIDLGNHWGLPFFPAGSEGQGFLDLQKSMYDYHNNLRATHPASSPWWAWPLDLKPVWFEQSGYSGDTTAVIYDTGNLVAFWLAIPAVAWTAYMAWKRRSLSLVFVTIAIASLWLPWARIDRATFQYHIFTTLPFSFMALAYFLAELWHGPSPRTWALARVGAAIAIIGAPLLWMLRLPLCGLARTEQVNAGTEVCAALSRQMTLTDLQLLGAVIAIVGLLGAGAVFVLRLNETLSRYSWQPLLMPALFSISLLGAAVIVIGAGIRGNTVFQLPVNAELPALGALVLLSLPAYFVLRAEDPRRYVIAAVGAAIVWFVAFYPNIASLPVPTPLSQIHLGLLPTWNWGFQFAVNMDEPYRGGLDLMIVAILGLAMIGLCAAAAFAVRAWRSARGATPGDSAVSPLAEAG